MQHNRSLYSTTTNSKSSKQLSNFFVNLLKKVSILKFSFNNMFSPQNVQKVDVTAHLFQTFHSVISPREFGLVLIQPHTVGAPVRPCIKNRPMPPDFPCWRSTFYTSGVDIYHLDTFGAGSNVVKRVEQGSELFR